MQRWALILASYSYHLEFRRTTEHGNVDALSRFPLHSKRKRSVGLAAEEVYHVEFFSKIVSAAEVKKETQTNEELTAVGRQKIGCLLAGKPVIQRPVWQRITESDWSYLYKMEYWSGEEE